MQWYFWLLIILIVIAAVAVALYFLHKKGKLDKIMSKMIKKRPMHEEYVWVGHGEHPFKGKDEEK
ncbi:hypothetical protein ACFL6I_13870 [candidate division KSB1 bacterium]